MLKSIAILGNMGPQYWEASRPVDLRVSCSTLGGPLFAENIGPSEGCLGL